MIIDEKGFTLSTTSENLATFEENLKPTFGNDFVIKKEGVIDNIAVASSSSTMDLEAQVAYLISQLNPQTAEGEWQDKLYSLIGLHRRQATYTIVQRTVSGTPNATIPAGELLIENASTKDQFRNNSAIQLNGSGLATGSFTAEESGAIELPSDATINIVNPLENVTGVYYSAGNTDNVGDDYESDDEFRKRWQVSSASANANTEDGLYKALLELVDSNSDLKIINNRTGSAVDGIPAHCMKIVINSASDNNTIAQTIMNNIVDGNQVGLQGDVSVDVTDSQGQTETIKFTRATKVDIYLQATITVQSGYTLASISNSIRENVFAYMEAHKFPMGSKIYANIFANSIYEVAGVAEVSSIELSDDGTSYDDYIQLSSEEAPSFAKNRIITNE